MNLWRARFQSQARVFLSSAAQGFQSPPRCRIILTAARFLKVRRGVVALSIMRKIFLRLSYNAVCARLNRYFFSRKGGGAEFFRSGSICSGRARACSFARFRRARIQSNVLAAQFIRSYVFAARARILRARVHNYYPRAVFNKFFQKCRRYEYKIIGLKKFFYTLYKPSAR